jgi:hypothetical protein
MVECPYCKGEKVFKRLISREWQEPEYENITCRLCEGNGKITELKDAIYKARGGLPPVPFRGFA